MDAFLKEGKWVYCHNGFCFTIEIGIDFNTPFQINPGNRTNIPTLLTEFKS